MAARATRLKAKKEAVAFLKKSDAKNSVVGWDMGGDEDSAHVLAAFSWGES
jgi:hypothetical protein